MNDNKSNPTPIALFVYNRLSHTVKTIQALQNNYLSDQSELYIFSDGPKSEKSIEEIGNIREYIRNVSGFKAVHIVEQEKNLGLANSIIRGVTAIINKYGKAIVLEDDLVTSPDFLTFMNAGLNDFEGNNKIWSITGYGYPVEIPQDYNNSRYLFIRPCSWGWGTWKDRWNVIDWDVKDYETFHKDRKRIKEFNQGGEDLFGMLKAQQNGEINSWAIRWAYAAFQQNKLSVHPCNSKIFNIGFDGSGEHCSETKKFDVPLLEDRDKNYHNEVLEPNKVIISNIKKYYKKDFAHKIWSIISDVLDVFGLRLLKRKIKSFGKSFYK